MPRADWCRPEIYALFTSWRRTCLMENGSLFSADEIWTEDNMRTLERTFAVELFGEGTFITKLVEQLADHPAPVRQLGIEILYLELLCERDTGRESKLATLGMV
ncbi:MAG: hypothetical protein AAGC46_18500, partial [Solirubrobacteraceae bacterium]